MNRITITLIAIAIATAAALSAPAIAQGRHDEKPHGYDAKVAAAHATPSTPAATEYITLPSGPRAQGSPVRVKKSPPTASMMAQTPASQSKAN